MGERGGALFTCFFGGGNRSGGSTKLPRTKDEARTQGLMKERRYDSRRNISRLLQDNGTASIEYEHKTSGALGTSSSKSSFGHLYKLPVSRHRVQEARSLFTN